MSYTAEQIAKAALVTATLAVVGIGLYQVLSSVPPAPPKNNSTIDLTHTPLHGDKQHAVAKWREVSYRPDAGEYKVFVDYVSDSMFCSGYELRTQ